jgi:hypothetical protein
MGGVVGLMIAHTAGLGGTARRVGLGVKVENDVLALEVGEADRLTVLVGKGECGGGFANRESHDSGA